MKKEKKQPKRWKRTFWIVSLGAVIGALVTISLNYVYVNSSKDEACMICHVHPHAEESWRQGVHHNTRSGAKVGCVECHLPPKGSFYHFQEKAKMGLKDVWSYITKDPEKINWEAKGKLEHAKKIVYNESCVACHVNRFPPGLSDEGLIAHMNYEENHKTQGIQCINCHLDAGHYNPNYSHARMTGLPGTPSGELFEEATKVTAFENFTEYVPATSISFDMKAIPGGSFMMGSPDREPLRQAQEGPQRQVSISPFFMAEIETTWDMFWAFYAETFAEGRTTEEETRENNTMEGITADAITGPTPPFGVPDQGWGGGMRPVVTITHYTAEVFCQWLSLKTGKTYRLPTEAEWEYAARGGTETPYFFAGNPKSFSAKGFLRGIFAPKTEPIGQYVVYALNSDGKTQEPSFVEPNPFGLKNMLGNALEYVSDWYAENYLALMEDGAINPQGPEEGTEHVVRGGSFSDDAANVRSASRRSTEHDKWGMTDPQQPKSIWWYSDINSIGFRVACEVPAGVSANSR
jgi:formylglycine-generating enzyme required for sulfatase activity/nitrate/TMAO reductase-like tetraheme cytochrome c subunit